MAMSPVSPYTPPSYAQQAPSGSNSNRMETLPINNASTAAQWLEYQTLRYINDYAYKNPGMLQGDLASPDRLLTLAQTLEATRHLKSPAPLAPYPSNQWVG